MEHECKHEVRKLCSFLSNMNKKNIECIRQLKEDNKSLELDAFKDSGIIQDLVHENEILEQKLRSKTFLVNELDKIRDRLIQVNKELKLKILELSMNNGYKAGKRLRDLIIEMKKLREEIKNFWDTPIKNMSSGIGGKIKNE